MVKMYAHQRESEPPQPSACAVKVRVGTTNSSPARQRPANRYRSQRGPNSHASIRKAHEGPNCRQPENQPQAALAGERRQGPTGIVAGRRGKVEKVEEEPATNPAGRRRLVVVNQPTGTTVSGKAPPAKVAYSSGCGDGRFESVNMHNGYM